MAEFNINGFSFDSSKLKDLTKDIIDEKNDKGLLSLFNIIDTNGDKKVDNTEISVFMQALQEYDKNNDNNIDKKEFKNFISTLKKNIKLDFKFDIETVKNLLNISLNEIEEPLTVIISDNIPHEKTDNEVKEDAITYIEDEYKNGLTNLEEYDEGIISKGYNAIKEYLGSNMAKSNVLKALYVKNEKAKLLRLAKSGHLTRKQIFELFRETLFATFPDIAKFSSSRQEQIKQHINALDEKQLVKYQHWILSLPNPDSDGYENALSGFLNAFKLDTVTTETKTFEVVQDNRSSKKTVESEKINEAVKNASSEDIITFEEVFYLEYGVEYSKQNMEKLLKNKSNYILEKQKFERKTQIHAILDDALALNKGNAAGGTSAELEQSSKQLESAIISVLKTLGANTDEEMTKLFQKLTGNNSFEINQNSIQRITNNNFSSAISSYELNSLTEKLLSLVDSNSSETGLERCENQFMNSYYETFGEDEIDTIVKAYMNDQESSVKTARMAIETTGAAAMIIGLFTCPPLAIGGAISGSVGGIAVEAVNEVSKKNINEEQIRELTKELAANVVLFASGMGAGKAGMMAKSTLIAKKCPRLVACIADIGLDSTLSLIADLSLTGQINIEGEGISQIVSLIAGHIKGGKIKLHNSAQDLTPGKNPAFNRALQDLAEDNPKLYEDYQLLRSKNMLPQSSMVYNPKNSSFTKEFISDMEKMAAAVRSGVKPIDAFIPKMKNLDEAIKMKNEGEVFSLEGTNDVYIKSKDGAVKLDMDRDMYFSLFPPLKSQATIQGNLGNCYFVSGFIDASMSNPTAKVEFMKHFHQRGNDLAFDVGYYNHAIDELRTNYNDMTYLDDIPTEIIFKNAVSRSTLRVSSGLKGSEGLKIAEQAFGYKMCAQRMVYDMKKANVPQDKIEGYIDELTKLFSDSSYKPSKEFKETLAKAYQMDKQRFENSPSNFRAMLMTKIGDFEAVRVRQAGRGGLAEHVLSSFYDLEESAFKKFDTIEDLVKDNSYNNPNCIILSATSGNASMTWDQIMMTFNPKYREQQGFHFVNGHQFRIASVNVNKNTVEVVNPWDCSKTVELDFPTFTKYFGQIQIADVTKTVTGHRSDYLVKQIEAYGMPTKSNKGRNYSTEELINNYIEKTGNRYNSYTERHFWGVDDWADEYKNLLNNPRVKEVVDSFCKMRGIKPADYASECYLAVFTNTNPAEMSKILDSMSNLIKSSNTIGKNFVANVISMKKTPEDYLFTLEHAAEIVTKMKQKNYNDSDVEYVLHILSKENYDALKYLFE